MNTRVRLLNSHMLFIVSNTSMQIYYSKIMLTKVNRWKHSINETKTFANQGVFRYIKLHFLLFIVMFYLVDYGSPDMQVLPNGMAFISSVS